MTQGLASALKKLRRASESPAPGAAPEADPPTVSSPPPTPPPPANPRTGPRPTLVPGAQGPSGAPRIARPAPPLARGEVTERVAQVLPDSPAPPGPGRRPRPTIREQAPAIEPPVAAPPPPALTPPAPPPAAEGRAVPPPAPRAAPGPNGGGADRPPAAAASDPARSGSSGRAAGGDGGGAQSVGPPRTPEDRAVASEAATAALEIRPPAAEYESLVRTRAMTLAKLTPRGGESDAGERLSLYAAALDLGLAKIRAAAEALEGRP